MCLVIEKENLHLNCYLKGLEVTGFDDKVVSLYARGMSMSEIQGHLEEIYQTEIKDLISRVNHKLLFLYLLYLYKMVNLELSF